MKKIAFHMLLLMIGIIVCYIGSVSWKIEMEDERTVDLVEKDPRSYPDGCELHNAAMQWDRVRIAYGLRDRGPNMKSEFPHSNKWIDGGCAGISPRYALIMFCSKCREAESIFEENWMRQFR